MSKKMIGFVRGGAFLALCLVLAAALFAGCQTDGGGDDWEDDHVLNTNLIGKWSKTFPGGPTWEESTETYNITNNTVSYPNDYSGFENAEIVFVYNFNESKTTGGIIIKRTEATYQAKPYLAVWFNDVKPKASVRWGNAYDTTKDYKTESTDCSAATFTDAYKKFSYANAPTYGGGSGNMGSALDWVPNP